MEVTYRYVVVSVRGYVGWCCVGSGVGRIIYFGLRGVADRSMSASSRVAPPTPPFEAKPYDNKTGYYAELELFPFMREAQRAYQGMLRHRETYLKTFDAKVRDLAGELGRIRVSCEGRWLPVSCARAGLLTRVGVSCAPGRFVFSFVHVVSVRP